MRVYALAALLVLAGCQTMPTSTVEVKVPVPVTCKAVDIPLPSLPFNEKARKSMSLFDKVKLLLAQDLNRQAYETELLVSAKKCEQTPRDPQAILDGKIQP